MNLDEIRKEIDAIDDEIVRLIVRRMEVSKSVAQAKIESGLPVFNPEREKVVIDDAAAKSGEYADEAKTVFSMLMDMSKSLQYRLVCADIENEFKNSVLGAKKEIIPPERIACQGAKGAYSQRAANIFFNDCNDKITFYKTFNDVINAVESGEVQFGVLPIENSTAGSVNEVYDLLCDHNFHIVKSAEVAIDNCLLGIKGASLGDIERVHSHPQALRQSSEFLLKRSIRLCDDVNTAVAAQRVAKLGDKSVGVVASHDAAKEYGLEVLAENINDCENNRTRFILISKDLIITDDADRISLSFKLEHTTGSLYRILSRFVGSGLNLTKIESRPVKSSEFEYRFYLDFTGSVMNKKTAELLTSLSCELSDFVFLGNYK